MNTKTRTLSEHEPGTWWWHKRPDGGHTIYPMMTFEKLDDLPVSYTTLFRCVKCKVEGTSDELKSISCSDPEWYHGDIRAYRMTHEPRRCNSCKHEWVINLRRGFANINCPKCTGVSTEKIP